MNDDIKKRFLRDISEHEMIILRDDGVFRHIRFGKPGTVNHRFDLVTWPWRLCYTGDMGDFVFSRLEDMFEFFRAPERLKKDGLYINTGYWAEKVLAVDRHDGLKQYSEDIFRTVIREELEDHEVGTDIRKEVEKDILEQDCTFEHEARQLVDEFNDRGLDFQFRNFWERDLQDFSYRFIWCCYAISWGIAKYDAVKSEGVS